VKFISCAALNPFFGPYHAQALLEAHQDAVPAGATVAAEQILTMLFTGGHFDTAD
jgi:hypothetical protein